MYEGSGYVELTISPKGENFKTLCEGLHDIHSVFATPFFAGMQESDSEDSPEMLFEHALLGSVWNTYDKGRECYLAVNTLPVRGENNIGLFVWGEGAVKVRKK